MGRYVKAIGLGETAALLSGVPVNFVKVVAFALSSLFAGLTGMALVARTYSGSPSAAASLLLPSIAAVVVGGTAITGGFGSYGRTIIGVLIITVLRVGIAIVGVDPGYEPLCYGLVVVCAAALTHRPRSSIGRQITQRRLCARGAAHRRLCEQAIFHHQLANKLDHLL